MFSKISILRIALLLAALGTAKAVEISQAEWDAVKKDISDLRKQRNADAPVTKREMVDKALEAKGYGPDASVKTRDGKLKIGGLMQNWYYGFQQDHRALFDDPAINSISDSNAASDANGFRVRRMELLFLMDVHENVSINVKIDPAKEGWNGAPLIIDNQCNTGYCFKTINNVGANYQSIVGSQKPFGFGSTSLLTKVQTGTGATFQAQLLENAFLNYHGVIPHHDFTIGQFEPWTGEESIRDNGLLDFVERSFVGLMDAHYLTGAFAHGSWWDKRFQYWVNAITIPDDYFGSATPNSANRAATHNDVDFGLRVLLRPVYKNETWGNLEIGGGALAGKHGESNNLTTLGSPGIPDNGLIAVKTNAQDDSAWLFYRPGCVASAQSLLN